MIPRVRRAREAELVALRRIEVDCEQRFLDAGIWFGPPSDPAELPDAYRTACHEGRLLVAVDAADTALGFASIDRVDGNTHLAEIDVSPPHQGRGIGTVLIEAVCGWAVGRGDGTLTLTTFRDVPWNGPFYLSRGFVEVPPEAQGPALAAILADEARRGMDPARRCAMKRQL